jgi:biotin transport system substrate-specific component
VAVLALWGSAHLSLPVPGSPVPVTLQTLAVLVAGILLGPRQAVLAVAAYLVAGALGFPLFAGRAAGLDVLAGPTGGFLIGFLPAAWLAGWWTRSGRAAGLGAAWLGMVLAHGVVLVSGWARLAAEIGVTVAWAKGVWPFLVGALVKSLIASLLWIALARFRQRSGQRS